MDTTCLINLKDLAYFHCVVQNNNGGGTLVTSQKFFVLFALIQFFSYTNLNWFKLGKCCFIKSKILRKYITAIYFKIQIKEEMGSPCDWQINKMKVNERGQYLLETSVWSDCKFIVGTEPHQKIFSGHKLFLAMSSPVFEAMFFGGMSEKNDPIPILDVQPDAFKALLEYIYTDAINLQSFDQACELCYVAKKYMLPHLVKECTQYVWHDLFPKNVCRAYEFAKLFEEPVLMKKCLEIMCSATEAVVGDTSFEEVELSTLITLLEQEELSIVSEITLFKALENWAKRECTRKGLPPNDNKSLRSVIGTALENVRFLTLTPTQFAEGPAQSPLLTQDESFALLMNISAAKMPLPDGFSSRPMDRLGRCPSSRCSLLREEPGSPETGGDIYREGHKYYCFRKIVRQPHFLNSSILDCSVTFMVDRNICVLGVQVPTQIINSNPEATPLPHSQAMALDLQQCTGGYTELLYAHLLDSDGSRLTYTHFTSRVAFGTLIEINFNRPVYIQRNKIYRVGVVFNKVGWYPMGACTKAMPCDAAFFTFCGGQPTDSVRDGLIRSIIFTY